MSGLFWYKILFMTELLIAEALFVARFPKRKLWGLRLVLSMIVCYACAFFYPLTEGSYNWWASSLMFVILFMVSLGGVYATFRSSFIKIFFCSIAAYTIQHLSYEIFNLINTTFFDVSFNAYGSDVIDFSQNFGVLTLLAVIYIHIYGLAYFIAFWIMGRKIQESDNLTFKSITLIFFAVFILLVDIVLNAVIQYIDSYYNETYDIVSCVYNILCCVVVFYIQLSMIKEKNTEKEMAVMSELFRQYERHYDVLRENNELFGRKYHDLKHYIGRFETGDEVNREIAQEIRKIISTYDSDMNTDNEALNIILTEKRLLCNDNDIRLTCMADGKSISFIKNIDLYALFGNILENAIDAVLKIENREKRCINFHLFRQGKMVIIKADNYYADEITIDEKGLPRTKKDGGQYHGFGMKSIQAITEKYNGKLYIEAKNNIFKLSIIFPGWEDEK